MTQLTITPYTPGMAIQAPCIISGMPNEVYHASEGISKSGLDLVNRSPAHYLYSVRKDPTRAMAIGTAIHAAVLEPELFASQYLLLKDVTDRRSSEYKQACKAHDPELVLTGAEAERVAGMQEAVLSNPHAADYLRQDNGWVELSVFAIDPATGVLCKCRFDKLTADLVAVDLKKTQDGKDRAFSRTMANYRYYVQAAFYTDVFMWATGLELQKFIFLAVEEEFPHFNKPWLVADDSYIVGRAEYRADLDAYAQSKADDYWPLPDQSEEYIFLPEWLQPCLSEESF